MLSSLISHSITSAARLITGARALWLGTTARPVQRLYYGNHRSHGDFVLLYAALPPALRKITRPIAGADYWLRGRFRRYLIQNVFNAVLIDRSGEHQGNPLEPMLQALEQGDSLIIFPEGTRNLSDDEVLLPFKSGLYHLAQSRPEMEIVPVWISNLGRVMPKGRRLPLPLLCTLTFGEPLHCTEGESKDAFLERARNHLLALAPEEA